MNLSLIGIWLCLIFVDAGRVSNQDQRTVTIGPQAETPIDDDDRRGSPLTIADLDAYLAALRDPAKAEPARRVSFRDLWDRPADYQGKRVEIDASIEQIFEHKSIGKFPELIELWGFSRVGDPVCLVFPRSNPERRFGRGTLVRFRGVFLKLLEYKARDADRIAPLIVGADPPVRASPDRTAKRRDENRFDHAFTAIAGGFTILFILIQLRRRSDRRPIPENDDPPQFIG